MNITEFNLGGSLIRRSLVTSKSSVTSLVNAVKFISDKGGIMAGVSMDVSKAPTFANAVHPEWRKSLFLAFLGTYVFTLHHD